MTAFRSNRLNESLVGKAQPRRPACSLNHPVYRLYICGVFHLKPHLVHDEKTEIRWHSIIRSEAQHPSPTNAIFSLCLCSWEFILMSYLCGDYILYSVLHVFIIPFPPCPRSVYFLIQIPSGPRCLSFLFCRVIFAKGN